MKRDIEGKVYGSILYCWIKLTVFSVLVITEVSHFYISKMILFNILVKIIKAFA